MCRCPGMQNATRVPPSLCGVTQISDPANPPPCACRTRLRDVCSTRPLRTVGQEPLYPHVFGPHVALEVGDHLMLFTIRRRSQVSLFLAHVGRTCTLDRRVNDHFTHKAAYFTFPAAQLPSCPSPSEAASTHLPRFFSRRDFMAQA